MIPNFASALVFFSPSLSPTHKAKDIKLLVVLVKCPVPTDSSSFIARGYMARQVHVIESTRRQRRFNTSIHSLTSPNVHPDVVRT